MTVSQSGVSHLIFGHTRGTSVMDLSKGQKRKRQPKKGSQEPKGSPKTKRAKEEQPEDEEVYEDDLEWYCVTILTFSHLTRICSHILPDQILWSNDEAILKPNIGEFLWGLFGH